MSKDNAILEDRPDWLPDFVSKEWIAAHINLTAADRRLLTAEFEFPTDCRNNPDAFLEEMYNRWVSDVLFPLTFHYQLVRCTNKNKAYKKAPIGHIRDRVRHHLRDNIGEPDNDVDESDVLEDAEEFGLLSELLYIESSVFGEVLDSIQTRVDRREPLNAILGPYLKKLRLALKDVENRKNTGDEKTSPTWADTVKGLQDLLSQAGGPNLDMATEVNERAIELVQLAKSHQDDLETENINQKRILLDALNEIVKGGTSELDDAFIERMRQSDADSHLFANYKTADATLSQKLSELPEKIQHTTNNLYSQLKNHDQTVKAYTENIGDDSLFSELTDARERLTEAKKLKGQLIQEIQEIILSLSPSKERGPPKALTDERRDFETASPPNEPTIQKPENDSDSAPVTVSNADAEEDEGLINKPSEEQNDALQHYPNTLHHVQNVGTTEGEEKNAKQAQQNPDTPGITPANNRTTNAFVTLANWNEWSLLYHLTVTAEHLNFENTGLPLGASLQLLNISRTVSESGSTASVACREPIEVLLGKTEQLGDGNADMSTILLAFSGCLRPALFGSSDSEARELLEKLPLGARLTSLHALREIIVGLTRKGLYPTIESLSKGPGRNPAPTNPSFFRERISDWLKDARNTRLNYVRANKVWSHLISEDGKIGQTISSVVQKERSAIQSAAALLSELNNDGRIDQVIRQAEKQLFPQKREKSKLVGGQLRRLHGLVGESKEHVRKWHTAALTQDQKERLPADTKKFEVLRTDLIKALDSANTGLEKLDLDGVDNSCVKATLTALKELRNLFDSNDPNTPLSEYRYELNAGLLKLPNIHFSHAWESSSKDELFEKILGYSLGESLSWLEALDQRTSENNHIATDRIIRFLSLTTENIADLEQLRKEREQSVMTARASLKKQQEETRRKIDRAFSLLETIDNDELILNLSTHSDRVQKLDPDRLPELNLEQGFEAREDLISDFPLAFNILDRTNVYLTNLYSEIGLTYGYQLKEITDNETAPQIFKDGATHLQEMLQKEKIEEVGRLLPQLQRNGELTTEVAERDVFSEFFPTFVDGISDGEIQFQTVQQACKSQEKIGPIDFSKLNESRIEEVRQLFGAWATIKPLTEKTKLKDPLIRILDTLGFQDARLTERTGEKSRRSRVFNLKCKTISGQDILSVPQFGSRAAGKYQIVLFARSTSVDEIVNTLTQTAKTAVKIAFYFGQLTSQERREFTASTHQHKASILLIDETLLFFLSLQTDNRLPILFDAALPFTWGNPYGLSEGNVPVEMFFGRKKEIQQLWDPDGPCLVYGGRQLGKTALLHHVKKLYHQPDDGVIISYVYCRSVGKGAPTKEIWPKIAASLDEDGLVCASAKTAKDVTLTIKEWLEKDTSRRVILMLDEMDSFFKQDHRFDFAEVEHMHALMRETDRRCKFVFSGLHDVQRASKTVNTPLAHMGDPISIGPLHGIADAGEAQRLVTKPLQSAGYQFEDTSLPYRILSDVEYYPSLVQVYCNQLIKEFENRTITPMDGPPFVVTSDLVERAFSGETTRRELSIRLQNTLDLDLRYRLIALVFTNRLHEQNNRISEGLLLPSIRNECLDYWEKGFEGETDNESFRVLLDEMVKLGILKETKEGWTLRSARIAKMIGEPTEIADDLLGFEIQKREEEYDLTIARRNIGQKRPTPSPLTSSQEHQIRQWCDKGKTPICLIFGSELLGSNTVSDALLTIEPKVSAVKLPVSMTAKDLAREIDRIDRKKKHKLLIVDLETPWAPHWIPQISRLDGLRKNRIKLVFLGGGAESMEWLLDPNVPLSRHDSPATFSLKLMFERGLTQWFQDIEWESLSDTKRIMSLTGGYHELISSLTEELRQARDWRGKLGKEWRTSVPERFSAERLGIPRDLAPFVTAITMAPDRDETISKEDIQAALELNDIGQFSEQRLDASLEWSEMMGLLIRVDDGWRINTTLRNVRLN